MTTLNELARQPDEEPSRIGLFIFQKLQEHVKTANWDSYELSISFLGRKISQGTHVRDISIISTKGKL